MQPVRTQQEWFRAVTDRNYPRVAASIDHFKRSADIDGDTALVKAVRNKDPEMVRLLAPHEAGSVNREGRTALIIAALHNFPEGCHILAPLESRLTLRDGRTALMQAAATGNLACVRELVTFYTHEKDAQGWTALDYAVTRGHYDCTRCICETQHPSIEDVDRCLQYALMDGKLVLTTYLTNLVENLREMHSYSVSQSPAPAYDFPGVDYPPPSTDRHFPSPSREIAGAHPHTAYDLTAIDERYESCDRYSEPPEPPARTSPHLVEEPGNPILRSPVRRSIDESYEPTYHEVDAPAVTLTMHFPPLPPAQRLQAPSSVHEESRSPPLSRPRSDLHSNEISRYSVEAQTSFQVGEQYGHRQDVATGYDSYTPPFHSEELFDRPTIHASGIEPATAAEIRELRKTVERTNEYQRTLEEQLQKLQATLETRLNQPPYVLPPPIIQYDHFGSPSETSSARPSIKSPLRRASLEDDHSLPEGREISLTPIIDDHPFVTLPDNDHLHEPQVDLQPSQPPMDYRASLPMVTDSAVKNVNHTEPNEHSVLKEQELQLPLPDMLLDYSYKRDPGFNYPHVSSHVSDHAQHPDPNLDCDQVLSELMEEQEMPVDRTNSVAYTVVHEEIHRSDVESSQVLPCGDVASAASTLEPDTPIPKDIPNPDPDENGNTVLMRVAQEGDLALVQKMLPLAGKTNYQGKTALMLAAERGYVDICRLLVKGEGRIQAKGDNNYTALIYAAQRGCTEVVRVLADFESGLYTKMGYTALMIAAQNGYTNCVMLLKDREAGLQTPTGLTGLICAASNGREACVKVLLDKEAGLSTNKSNMYGEGFTALMAAARMGARECVRILLPYEAPIRQPNGKSALDYANESWYSNTPTRDMIYEYNLKHQVNQTFTVAPAV
ncbi:Ankyrin repeat protein 1 [Giardia muris]|uniref:Ankyrin repeat protein 1 n=1 Tax=Giardia muris TaxID=5742 RepID=A0A4Z1T4F7_GIAMU|nr:Ankyrin repeat protein 1 [Giardia muris]|eukprot:TNJ27937.1 Ankyrin repeat protein 1 [Giardia muris]